MKTKTIQIALIALSATFIGLTSCKKDKDEPVDENPQGSVKIEIEHLWGMGTMAFQMETDLVHPMNNDTMNFTTFKYYISNFQLKKADGTWWTHPESYFLVDLSNSTTPTLDLGSLPVGEYTDMRYVLGVDSTRNVSGAQTGALSTTNGMFWSWNTGYIMLKAEGTSPQSGTGSFTFHLGGFSGINNVVTQQEISFSGNSLTISKDHTSEVHITANPARLFHEDPLSSGTNTTMPGAKAKQMATNYYASFAFDHLVE